jgi:hypothetical protein
MRRFLGFIAEYALSSPNEPLKEMIIGVELYARRGAILELLQLSGSTPHG